MKETGKLWDGRSEETQGQGETDMYHKACRVKYKSLSGKCRSKLMLE